MVFRASLASRALFLVALTGSAACGSDEPAYMTTCLSHPIDGDASPSTFDPDDVNELLAALPALAEQLGFDEATGCAQALAAVDALGYAQCTCE